MLKRSITDADRVKNMSVIPVKYQKALNWNIWNQLINIDTKMMKEIKSLFANLVPWRVIHILYEHLLTLNHLSPLLNKKYRIPAEVSSIILVKL